MERFGKRKKRLGDLLLEAKIITEEQLVEALQLQKRNGKKLGETLVDLDYTRESEIANLLHKQLGISYVNISERVIPQNIIALVGEDFLRKNSMIPYAFKESNPNILLVATSNPLDIMALDDLSIITNYQVEPAIATHQDVESAIDRYYGNQEAMKVAEQYTKERENLYHQETQQDINSEEVEKSPIAILVRSIIEQGIRQRVSDIHIEALENNMRVRYRVDGVLDQGRLYNLNLLSAVTARIKILSGLDISEKRKPQDGRMTMVLNRGDYDIRVSILPTVYGEKTVMRLALKQALTKDKQSLGFTEEDLRRVNALLGYPHGIILVTGPTGSGKSTTLYTILSELNRSGVNIITVEDPVEANIDGINQVQVNNKAELTFASALRSILRQDPDIIMIGEIRDKETAEIAVKASITGHLVLSTLHTNSAAGTVMRLVDMGIEPYLLADALTGVIAQRLVRCLCNYCKKEYVATEDEKELLGVTEEIHLYQPCGCLKCNNTGYIGRIGLYEIMPINRKLKYSITHHALSEEMNDIAMEDGMKTLYQRAREVVLSGLTSIEEIKRLAIETEE